MHSRTVKVEADLQSLLPAHQHTDLSRRSVLLQLQVADTALLPQSALLPTVHVVFKAVQLATPA